MKIFNFIRNPFTAIILAFLVLFVSCEQYDQNFETGNSSFDYSLFETYKGKMLSINFNNKLYKQETTSELTRLELNNLILNDVNSQLNTNLDYANNFKSLDISSTENIINWSLDNNVIDEIDAEILNSFTESFSNNGLEVALTDLETRVLQSNNLSSFKVEKYEQLANTARLMENQDPGLFSQGDGCIGAIIGLIFAVVALILACPTVPMGGVTAPACYFAAVNFIRASVTVGNEC